MTLAVPHRCPPPVLEQDVVLRSETVVKLFRARHVTIVVPASPAAGTAIEDDRIRFRRPSPNA